MNDIEGEVEIVIYSDTINKYESFLNERNLILVDAEIKNETNQGFRIIGRRIRSLNQFISDNLQPFSCNFQSLTKISSIGTSVHLLKYDTICILVNIGKKYRRINFIIISI